MQIMYLIQERSIMKDLNSKGLKYFQFMKDRYWRDLQRCKSILFETLNDLSSKSDEDLTKRELLELISVNCDYMKAYDLYNYYANICRELRSRKLDNKDNEERE